MSFLKRFVRKKHSAADSTQSTSKMISDRGSYIVDYPVASSFQDEETRSNNNSESYIKKVLNNVRKPETTPQTATQLTPHPIPASNVSARKSPSPQTRRSNQASIVDLKAKLRQLSGSVDRTTFVASVVDSVKSIAQEKNSFESELRHLDTRIRASITDELDASNAWKALAARLTHPDRPSEPLFTDIQLLNNRSKEDSPSDEILKTWSTTGRNRPRIQDLYNVLVDILQLKIAQRLKEEIEGTRVSLSLAVDSEHIALRSNGHMNDTSNDSTANFSNMKACLSKVYQICFNDIDSDTDHFSPTSRAKIGEGSFGVVYKVKIDGQYMAVKVFKEDIQQIANEIEQLSALKHPNVLSLYGIAVGEESVCMITKFMENGSLQQKLSSVVLDWPLRFRILRDVAAGLEYVHSVNVMHRDVKPANILLDANMNALIGDFGLARKKQSSGTSRTQFVAGSSDYMAPEILRGVLVLASDVYSFGVVALEMFTGLPAYDELTEEFLTDHVLDKTSHEVCDTRIAQPSGCVREDCYRDIQQCLRKRSERPDMKYIHRQFRMYFEYVCNEDFGAVRESQN